jgi:hypothetical protein
MIPTRNQFEEARIVLKNPDAFRRSYVKTCQAFRDYHGEAPPDGGNAPISHVLPVVVTCPSCKAETGLPQSMKWDVVICFRCGEEINNPENDEVAR